MKSGLLSKYAVPINKLETAIANIILEKKTLRPVYDTNDLEQIYKSKLTHTCSFLAMKIINSNGLYRHLSNTDIANCKPSPLGTFCHK